MQEVRKLVQFGFTFKIKPEMKAEYKEAHDNIWSEYADAVRNAGITNQSIFYRKDGTLFLYFESEDPEKSLKIISKNPLNDKWQREMEKFLLKEDSKYVGSSPKKGSALEEFRPEVEILEQVFYQK